MRMLFKDNSNSTYIDHSSEAPVIKSRLLDSLGFVQHGFSTRDGGVSKGIWASMNTSFSRGDDPEDVLENYRIIGRSIGISHGKMVLTSQTHTVNIARVFEEDRGNGVVRENKFHDIDGLITNSPDVCLVSSHADCVSLCFADPVKKAIGLSHSGWRGSVNRMGEETLKAMNREFGSEPGNIYVYIGPSICMDCYEVGQDVIDEIEANLGDVLEKYGRHFIRDDHNGKYHLDMQEMNRCLLMLAGVPKEHIEITSLCTACNPEHLWSHRKHGEGRGSMSAFLCLTGNFDKYPAE